MASAQEPSAKQGKYRKFQESLMSGPRDVSPELIAKLAGDLGLDPARLKKDMDSAEISGMLGRNQALADAIGVESTPGFVIGREVFGKARREESVRTLGVTALFGCGSCACSWPGRSAIPPKVHSWLADWCSIKSDRTGTPGQEAGGQARTR